MPLPAAIHIVVSPTRVVVEGELLAHVQDVAPDGRPRLVQAVFDFLKRRRQSGPEPGGAVTDRGGAGEPAATGAGGDGAGLSAGGDAPASHANAGEAADAASTAGIAIYWVDRHLPAAVVKSVFQSAAFAGYPNGCFIVRRADAPAEWACVPAAARVPGMPVHQTPRARGGVPTVTRGLAPAVIQQRIRQQSRSLRACYDAGLARNPKLSGHLRVRFVIGPDGSVSSVKDAGSTLPDAQVIRCMLEACASFTFPEPDVGSVTVVYPIHFATK